MSFSYNDFGPKSPGDTITVDFVYERREDIEVLVDGALVDENLWEWANAGLLLCKVGFPSGLGGRVQRRTPIGELVGRLTGTAVLDYPTINGNFDRLLFRLQEQDDGEADRESRVVVIETLLETQQADLDGSVDLGRRWAEEDEDVEVAEGHYSSKHHAAKAGGHASSASSAKDAAIAARGGSESARDGSISARGGSEAARDLAARWAEEDEDVEVAEGHYSSKHWSLKAASTVLGGIASAIQAAVSKVTPNDNDLVPLVDSQDGWGLKKLTWANLKATLKTYFDGLYLSLSGGTMGTGAIIAFAAEVGEKIRFYGSGYGAGVEASTLTLWGGPTFRYRNGSSSGTIVAEIVAAATQAQHLTRKDYVDAAVANKAGVYTGSTQDETNFPIGHPIACGVSPLPARNATVVPRVDSGSITSYLTSGTGGILAGTWRSRGNATTGVSILQRTA